MDEKIFNALMSIGKTIPKELLSKAIKKEYVFKHERDAIGKMIKDRRISEKKKIKLRELLNDPKLLVEKDVVDFKVSQEIEKYIEDKVKFAIETGILPKPKEDDFIKKIQKNLNENNSNDGVGKGV